ncbi:hypothetical protein B0H14DRAFT_2628692 [Mycena olivaceomarginata]|nr:hypothetical protein B0H14DRAFT_2628692 [Mycena olivaceomarginata]
MTHPAEIHKGLLENRRDANGQASVVGNIDRNETSAVLATHTVQIPIPGSVRLVENHAELYPRNRWMDTATYLHSTQTISKSCSAALLNHDYTYYMDESDKMWLDNTNYQCRIEERIAQEPRSADTQEICGRLFISAPPITCELASTQVVIASVYVRETKLHQELPDFSIFKPFFLAQLHPDTFASLAENVKRLNLGRKVRNHRYVAGIIKCTSGPPYESRHVRVGFDLRTSVDPGLPTLVGDSRNSTFLGRQGLLDRLLRSNFSKRLARVGLFCHHRMLRSPRPPKCFWKKPVRPANRPKSNEEHCLKNPNE